MVMAMMLVMSENVLHRYGGHDEVDPEISDDHDRRTSHVIAVFLHPKTLQDMFIFARKDPAVLAA
jgi:hypothetical protein